MDLLIAILYRGWHTSWASIGSQETIGYADCPLVGGSKLWKVFYDYVLEVSAFRRADEDPDAPHTDEPPVYVPCNSEALDELIELLQMYNPGFKPVAEDRPQIRRRQVATELARLATTPMDSWGAARAAARLA